MTRKEFPAIRPYKKSIGLYKRGSGTWFPEARQQVRVNFQEVRGSGTGFKSSRNAVREGG
jgi:hypothetical protein